MPPVRVDAGHFSPDVCAFVEILHDHGVRYLIVGGEAVIFHGHVRLTGDVDFSYDPEPDNLARLHAAVSDFWDGEIPGDLTIEDLARADTVIQFGLPPNRIDLIHSVGAGPFEEAWAGRVEAVLALEGRDVPLQYIGLATLIETKRAAGRPQDLADLEFLTKKQRG